MQGILVLRRYSVAGQSRFHREVPYSPAIARRFVLFGQRLYSDRHGFCIEGYILVHFRTQIALIGHLVQQIAQRVTAAPGLAAALPFYKMYGILDFHRVQIDGTRLQGNQLGLADDMNRIILPIEVLDSDRIGISKAERITAKSSR